MDTLPSARIGVFIFSSIIWKKGCFVNKDLTNTLFCTIINYNIMDAYVRIPDSDSGSETETDNTFNSEEYT